MNTYTNGHGPVRVFVGTSAGGEDAEACAVLEYTLRRHASEPVEINWLALSRNPCDPCCGWHTESWSTPWTALRWAVPALCGWQGRAVYFDCPTIVLGDVAALARAPLPAGACVLTRRAGATIHPGCLVFDCAAAKKWFADLDGMRADVGAHQTVGRLLSTRPKLVGDLPPGWGARDQDYSRDPASVTGSVHCAAPAIQPHQWHARGRLRVAGREHWFEGTRLPHYCQGLVDLFNAEYTAARAAGHAPEQYVFDEAYGPYAIGGRGLGGRKTRAESRGSQR